MRPPTMARLGCAILLVAVLGFGVVRGPSRPPGSPPFLVHLTQLGMMSEGTVHPTTEADLALVRSVRPTWDGPVPIGLHMRWCSAQNACR